MPTYRDLASATGCSKTLIRTLVDEIDPKHEHVSTHGRSLVVDDWLASAVAAAAQGRARGVPSDEVIDLTPLEVIERSHHEAMDAIRETMQATIDEIRETAQIREDGLREQIAERDRRIAALEADRAEMAATIERITGASWLTRAFSLHRLLPSRSLKNN